VEAPKKLYFDPTLEPDRAIPPGKQAITFSKSLIASIDF